LWAVRLVQRTLGICGDEFGKRQRLCEADDQSVPYTLPEKLPGEGALFVTHESVSKPSRYETPNPADRTAALKDQGSGELTRIFLRSAILITMSENLLAESPCRPLVMRHIECRPWSDFFHRTNPDPPADGPPRRPRNAATFASIWAPPGTRFAPGSSTNHSTRNGGRRCTTTNSDRLAVRSKHAFALRANAAATMFSTRP